MKVGKFELSIQAKDLIILPPYKGSTLRGGFGNAFKKIVCALKEKDCPDCILKEQCVYSYIFETPPPAGAKMMRKYPSVPHPFIIEPPMERRMGYKPGDDMAFGLTLIGKAIDYLPYFIYTFDELGNIGIGKGRGKYRLKTVFQKKTTPMPLAHCRACRLEEDTQLYASETRKLSHFNPESLAVDIEPRDDRDEQTTVLTLNFLSPTRIYYSNHLTCDLEFHILIRQLLRRISMLSYFHCGIDPSVWDFKGCIEKGKNVAIKNRNLRWYGWERYSARQDQKIDMGGFVGEITYEGNLAPFMSLIKAGEILHVGKGTTFGLGKYQIQDHR
ncbi:CRISPR system precrRNA processing endoribonuclease RAMP protein Cas6 [Patescibacteria group bacterium]|nr:CRISPR system precrRNA processing endoribonuclease RAMP protein Cas6 [Patescibacteria group bacterium]